MAAGGGECLVDSRHPAVCKTLGIHAAMCLVFVCNMFGFYLTKHSVALSRERELKRDGAVAENTVNGSLSHCSAN